MKRFSVRLAISLITVCGILVSGVANANDKTTLYAVTITNITRGQTISPPIVISHNKDFQLFSLGNPESPASPGLALLAEEGMPTTLATELSAMESVFQYSTAEDGITPGTSVTVEIETKKSFRLLSAAGMLVNSNDAFFAILGVDARSKGDVTVNARAYDAGTEVNSEQCAYIPGCGGGGIHDPAVAEGYVYIHSGIHGNIDLDPAEADWNNPVATILVQRVK
jgi:hypothetical protein